MLKFLEKARNCNSWFSLGERVYIVTWPFIFKWFSVSIGGVIIMPWYSNVGFVFISLGLLMICYDLYKNYIQRTLPIMEAVYLIESYLKKKNAKIKYNITDVVFWDSKSIYSGDIKGIMSLIIQACKEGKLALFGKQGALPERKIEPFEIDKDRIQCREKKYLPQINDNHGKAIFVDLALEKRNFVEWIKNLSSVSS